MYARPQGPLGAPSFARSSNPKKNPDQLHIFIYKSYIDHHTTNAKPWNQVISEN